MLFKSFGYAILIRHILAQPWVWKVEALGRGVHHPSLEFLWVHSVKKVENHWLRVCAFFHCLFLAIVYEYDAVHKTESTLRIKTPPEEDRAMVVGSMHKIGEDWIVVDEDWICSSGDILRSDRPAGTSTHTDLLVTILSSITEGEVIISSDRLLYTVDVCVYHC